MNQLSPAVAGALAMAVAPMPMPMHDRVRPGMFPGIHFEPNEPAPVASPAGPASTLQEAVSIILQMRQQADQDSQEFRNNWKAVNERLSDLEVRLARPPAGPQRRDDAPPSAARAAFRKMLQRGMNHLTPEEQRTLIVGDDTAGGYLAPPEFEAEVIKAVTQISPIRSIARVTPITGRALLIPTRTSTPTAYWVNEIDTVTTSQSAYGQKEIAPYTLMADVRISRELLEDGAVDVEAEIMTDMAEQFAAAEGLAFCTGSGVLRPEGFVANSTVVANHVVSGSGSTLAADGLISLMMALKSPYAANGTWVLNRSTMSVIRKLKDTTNQYIWQPNYQAGQPPTLLGAPYIEAPDMPDVAANTYPVAFGDFRRGYRIVDRVGISVIRDDVTLASSGSVKFVGRRRVGGLVTLAEAIKIQKVST